MLFILPFFPSQQFSVNSVQSVPHASKYSWFLFGSTEEITKIRLFFLSKQYRVQNSGANNNKSEEEENKSLARRFLVSIYLCLFKKMLLQNSFMNNKD